MIAKISLNFKDESLNVLKTVSFIMVPLILFLIDDPA